MNKAQNIKAPKSILQYLVILILLVFCSSVNIYARDFHVPDGILTIYLGSGGDIILPDDVQKVGVSVFQNNKDITSVIVPEGCFAIEDGAFEGCSNLRTISLPSTLNSIGTLAFNNCTSLEYIILPQGLSKIGEGAFAGCTSLGAVTVPSTVTDMGPGCFCKCTHLSMIEVDPSSRYYSTINGVLYSYDQKTLIQYPAGKPDTEFSIPYNVETILNNAFAKSSNLRKVTFSDTVKNILPYAFSGCTGLTRLDLPENLEMIREHSFRHCSNLNRLYVHGKDTQTVIKAFEGDTSLILYGPNNSKIEQHARKYNMRFRSLDDDTYDYSDTEIIF